MRDGNPRNMQNWKVVCSACGAEFAPDETIDLTSGHFQQEHPDIEGVHLNTIWCGKGPEPRGNRARGHQRRR